MLALYVLLLGMCVLLSKFFGQGSMRMPKCPFCHGEGEDGHAEDCKYRDRW